MTPWTSLALPLLALAVFFSAEAKAETFALRLDGRDDRIEIRESRNLDFPGPFTIEAWIRPDGWGPDPQGGFARILDKSSYTLLLNRRGADYMDRTVALFLTLADGTGIGVSGPADAVTPGLWTHVAVSYDGASEVRMAVNGTPVPVFQPNGPPAGPLADASWSPLFLGDSPNQERFFSGDIGPVRLWSTVRPAEAIARDRFDEAVSGESLVAHWPMAEGEGAVLPDRSGNGNDGEIVGATWAAGPAPDTDADGDGVPDRRDECPLDPAKTAPGECGCGVSDSDADQDGVPDCRDDNQSPDRPETAWPPDHLFPVPPWPLTLQAGDFADADSDDFMSAAHWQIAGSDGFEPPLFGTQTTGETTRLALPPMILDGGAAYRWRVRLLDGNGDPSPWSRESRFATTAELEDLDGDGVPDGQEPPAGLDLDGNGAPDEAQTGLLAVETAGGNGPAAVRAGDGVTAMERLAAFSAEDVDEPPPAETPLGLLGFRFAAASPAALAQVFLHWPVPVPADAGWIARTARGDWIDIRDRLSRTPEGHWVIRIVEGGPEDLDGSPNGRGALLLGPTAVEPAPNPAPEAYEEDDGGGGGCFLDAIRHGKSRD
ncbi:MAG: LamG domain-containing protein [Desulfococcaceae bacterium]